MQLSVEDIILRQVYPDYFYFRIKHRYSTESDLQDPKFQMVLEQLDEMQRPDPNQLNYVPIRKDQFLKDIKQFLYNYCISGRIYSNYDKN